LHTTATLRPVSSPFWPKRTSLIRFIEGLSIDEAFSLFEDGYGVKKSKQMRKEKAEMQKHFRNDLLSGASPVEMVNMEKNDGALHNEHVNIEVK